MFDWDKALVNLNEKVFICKILLSILNTVSIFIPLETLIIMIQTFHDLQQIQKMSLKRKILRIKSICFLIFLGTKIRILLASLIYKRLRLKNTHSHDKITIDQNSLLICLLNNSNLLIAFSEFLYTIRSECGIIFGKSAVLGHIVVRFCYVFKTEHIPYQLLLFTLMWSEKF